MAEARRWAGEIARMSPTAIRFLKHSFNTDTEHQAGLANMATAALDLFTDTPEAREGVSAFLEKRTPGFAVQARGDAP
jgi:naphthoate synthase